MEPWVKEYMGIPFRDHGRDRRGLDCFGLLRLVLGEQFGVWLPSYSEVYTTAGERGGAEIERAIRENEPLWDKVPRGKERPGDVVLMRIKGFAMHVGVVVEKGKMLHILEGIDSAVEEYGNILWRKRILGIYRYAER